MLLHFHYSPNPHSGEIRRIRNIDEELSALSNVGHIEVEFYPLRQLLDIYKGGNKFFLSNKIEKKFYFPQVPFRHLSFFRFIDELWTSFLIWLVVVRYNITIIVGEYSVCSQSLRFINKNKKSKRRIIVDVHGASPEEYEYNAGCSGDKMSQYLSNKEKQSFKKADDIICQSYAMKQHIVKKYGIVDSKISVYHCGVDLNKFKLSPEWRKDIREQYGIGVNTTVFVYSGGMHKWQKVEDSILIFVEYHKIYPDSFLFLLTKDTDLAHIYVDKYPSIMKSVVIISLAPEEVYKYLNASDVAFLLRDNVVMNAVASPTKLAEYMACGLPVISGIVAKNWIQNAPDGILLCIDSDNYVDVIYKSLLSSNPNFIRDYAKDNLSLEIDSNRFKNYFKAIFA